MKISYFKIISKYYYYISFTNGQNVNQPFNIPVKNIQDRIKLKNLSKLLKNFTLSYRLIFLSCKLIFLSCFLLKIYIGRGVLFGVRLDLTAWGSGLTVIKVCLWQDFAMAVQVDISGRNKVAEHLW